MIHPQTDEAGPLPTDQPRHAMEVAMPDIPDTVNIRARARLAFAAAIRWLFPVISEDDRQELKTW